MKIIDRLWVLDLVSYQQILIFFCLIPRVLGLVTCRINAEDVARKNFSRLIETSPLFHAVFLLSSSLDLVAGLELSSF